MLISIDELKTVYTDMDFSKYSDERLKRKLEAIESAIVEYTGNKFYDKESKTEVGNVGGQLVGNFTRYKVGDKVEVYNSKFNDGIYYVAQKNSDTEITLNATLKDEEKLFKLIRFSYPLDVIEGCINLLNYDLNMRDNNKVGISSETISRHSVSYVNRNNTNTMIGYPIELVSFLTPYMEWRT